MDPNEELVGADLMEHRVRHSQIGISRALSALSPLKVDLDDVINVPPIGMNPGHEGIVTELHAVQSIHSLFFTFYWSIATVRPVCTNDIQCVCVCSFLIQPNGRILKKAGEKLKRLNDFYDNMDKKTRKESRAQIKTPLQQVRSVFPRRSHAHKSGASTMPHAHDMNPSIATSETAFGRYVQRRSIAEPNSRQATEGHTNFAWIDWENRIDVCAWRRTHTTYNEYENKKF